VVQQQQQQDSGAFVQRTSFRNPNWRQEEEEEEEEEEIGRVQWLRVISFFLAVNIHLLLEASLALDMVESLRPVG
jgi:hypothetical protein